MPFLPKACGASILQFLCAGFSAFFPELTNLTLDVCFQPQSCSLAGNGLKRFLLLANDQQEWGDQVTLGLREGVSACGPELVLQSTRVLQGVKWDEDGEYNWLSLTSWSAWP